jgi:nucleoside-diphosphate-sugar epimerase
MDVSKMKRLGWQARISLVEGIKEVYGEYEKKLTVDR